MLSLIMSLRCICICVGYFEHFIVVTLKSSVADAIPSCKAMLLQIYVSMKALPWYALLPTITEYVTETGWTRCFPRVNHVGWLRYLVYVALYLIIVEFGIYWMHKWLHDIKLLYKHLHAIHHIYNKQNTLSPFAGEYIINSTSFMPR